jgi:hypothetical protein
MSRTTEKRSLFSDGLACLPRRIHGPSPNFPPPILNNDHIDDTVVNLFNALDVATKRSRPDETDQTKTVTMVEK